MPTLHVVATPIGNLGDFTPRAIETLKKCRYVLAEDTRHSGRLLAAFDIETPLRSYYQFNEMGRSEQVITDMLSGTGDVALITDAGTPCISDPGYHVVRKAHAAGIKVVAVSGPSAVVTALSVSGLPSDRFAFYGFPPRGKKQLLHFLSSLRSTDQVDITTHVMYESPKRIINLMRQIEAVLPQTHVSVSTELTKRHEKTLVGDVTNVLNELEADPYATKGEYTIVLHFPEPSKNGRINEPKDSSSCDVRQYAEGAESIGATVSLEALIVDVIVKNNMTIKDAVAHIATQYGVARNEAYAAGLKLRELFDPGV